MARPWSFFSDYPNITPCLGFPRVTACAASAAWDLDLFNGMSWNLHRLDVV